MGRALKGELMTWRQESTRLLSHYEQHWDLVVSQILKFLIPHGFYNDGVS